MARILLDAIRCGNISLAKDIIEKETYGGIDSQTSRRDGTSLFFCCSRGYLELAILLLNKNANVNARNKCQATPLHAAADNNHLRIASLLLDRGADINAQTQRGDTPLHLAGFRGHADIAQCLVEREADFLLLNESNMTPAVEAFSRGHLEVGQYLNAIHDLYGPSSSFKGKISSDLMVRLDPPSPISQPLPPPFQHNNNNTPVCSSDRPHRQGVVLEPSRHDNQLRVTSPPPSLRQSSSQSRPGYVSFHPINTTRDAMNDYLFQNVENNVLHSGNTHALSNNNTILKNGPPDQHCQTNRHHESLRPIGGSHPHHQHHQHHQHPKSDFYNELPVNHRREPLQSHPKEPVEDIDYSIIYFPPSATMFPSNNVSKTNDILLAHDSLPLPPGVTNDDRVGHVRMTSDKHSVLSSGSDGSSCYGDARRDDFDAMHNALYQTENIDGLVGVSNDYPMQPALSLRNNQPIVYNRLPSTPSSITSIELLDPFESSRFNQDSTNPNQRTTSPMSVELHSSYSRESMETSAKDSCGASDAVNDLIVFNGSSLPCGNAVKGCHGNHQDRPFKQSSMDIVCPSNPEFSCSSISMNDLSSVTSRPVSSNTTVLHLNIPV